MLQIDVYPFQPTSLADSAYDLVLKLRIPDGKEVAIWTNHCYHMPRAAPPFNIYRVFDVELIENHIYVSYQDTGELSVAEISTSLLGSREAAISSFGLLSGYSASGDDMFTNAVFSMTTNRILTLTAQCWRK